MLEKENLVFFEAALLLVFFEVLNVSIMCSFLVLICFFQMFAESDELLVLLEGVALNSYMFLGEGAAVWKERTIFGIVVLLLFARFD